jgi:hypothetical protein
MERERERKRKKDREHKYLSAPECCMASNTAAGSSRAYSFPGVVNVFIIVLIGYIFSIRPFAIF